MKVETRWELVTLGVAILGPVLTVFGIWLKDRLSQESDEAVTRKADAETNNVKSMTQTNIITDLGRHIDRLKAQVQSLDQINCDLRSQLEALRADSSSIRDESLMMRKENLALRGEINVLRDRIDALMAAIQGALPTRSSVTHTETMTQTGPREAK